MIMNDSIEAALCILVDLNEEQMHSQLTNMLLVNPELFLSVADDLDHHAHEDFLAELRGEMHNGHHMYPELQE